MLKSPVMTNSDGDVMISSRTVEISDRNNGIEAEGGRYIVR